MKKTNAELQRLDKEIRLNMARARGAGDRVSKLVSAQAPVGFRATLSGIIGGSQKAKKAKKSRKKRI